MCPQLSRCGYKTIHLEGLRLQIYLQCADQLSVIYSSGKFPATTGLHIRC